jgi:hypothetical protein
MSTAAFDRFIAEEQRKYQIGAGADPEFQLKDFLDALDQLYNLVSGILASYVQSGQVSISYRKITISEETIEPYDAHSMLIRIGSKTIRFVPVGMIQVAARGRVDVIGPRARTQLLRLDSRAKSMTDLIWGAGYTGQVVPVDRSAKIEWVWRWVTRPPEQKIVELKPDSIFDLLVEIAHD